MPGPKGLLQEKFQRTAEQEKPEDHQWVSAKSQRHVFEHEYDNSDNNIHADAASMTDPDLLVNMKIPRTNMLPPGMFIDNQEPYVTDKSIDYVAAGATDVSNKTDAGMMKYGYHRQNMTPVDDMYNNEHVEEFYGEAKGTDDKGKEYTGFAERNNYLDRN